MSPEPKSEFLTGMEPTQDDYERLRLHCLALENGRRDLMSANQEAHDKIGALERGNLDLQEQCSSRTLLAECQARELKLREALTRACANRDTCYCGSRCLRGIEGDCWICAGLKALAQPAPPIAGVIEVLERIVAVGATYADAAERTVELASAALDKWKGTK